MDKGWRLRLVRAAGVTILADPALAAPYQARFQGPAPKVEVGDGTVAVEYRRHRFPPFDTRAEACTITLNGSVPWLIEASGGLAHVTASLETLQLLGFEVRGGARAVVLSLPRPWGAVPVRLLNGASDVAVHRPAGVGARVQVDGGSRDLTLDDQRFGAVGGQTVWQSANYETAASRYDVTIHRGARAVTVDVADTGDRRGDLPDRLLVTVLFTDIVASTERAARVGDRRWRELLEVHDELAGRLVEQFHGQLVKTTGDGILATFDGPGRAIRCAAAFRDELSGIGVQIRAGLHTGEIELRDDDVGGIAVHIAARVMAAAEPGRIVTSRTVHDLVVGSDIAMDDLGTRPLKGVDGSWRLFAARP